MAIGTTAALIGGALIGGGASMMAAKKQAGAVSEATHASTEATQKQMEFLQEGIDKGIIDIDTAYNIARGYIEPYSEPWAYNKARSFLESPEQVMSLPGVQFEYDQGRRMLENMVSGMSGGASGDAMKAAMEYGQNFAATKLDRAIGRLTPFVNLGYGASTNLANLAAGAGSGKANLRIGGATQGAGYLGDLGSIAAAGATQQGNIAAQLYSNLGQTGQNVFDYYTMKELFSGS